MRTVSLHRAPSLARRTLALCVAGLSALALNQAACGSSDPLSVFDGGAPDGQASSSSGFGSFGDSSVTEDGGPLADAACATGAVAATRSAVYLQVVVDGSGSMDGYDGNAYLAGEREADPEVAAPRTDLVGAQTMETGRKWIALRGALKAFYDELAARPDPFFAVGMYLFSSNTLKPANAVDVPISFVNPAHASSLKARLSPPVFPQGGTPLLASIQGQVPVLVAYAPTAPVKPGGKRALVVVTDGVPTVGPGQTQAQANTDVVNALDAARTATPSVLSFVIGVGNPAGSALLFDPALLGRMATAGGTAEMGCNPTWSGSNMVGRPCHVQVTPGSKTAAQLRQDFLDAFNRIRDLTTSCELNIDAKDAANLDPNKVNVYLTTGGMERPLSKGSVDGWTYDNDTRPTKVILNGKSCRDLKSDPNASARLEIGCVTRMEGPR
jgi:hypothetical protein